MDIDKLLDILRCPECHSEMHFNEDANKFDCSNCGEKYSLINGIPLMISSKELKKGSTGIYGDLCDNILENRIINEKVESYGLGRHSFEDLRQIKKINIKDKIIIDAGGAGGHGFIARNLAEEAKLIFVVDLSLDSLLVLKKIKCDNMVLFCGDITRSFFAPKIADIIICTAVLEHLHEPIDALYNFKKTLNEGGILFVEVPIINLPFSSSIRYVFNKLKKRNMMDVEAIHPTMYSTKLLINDLTRAGFSILEVEYMSVLLEFKCIPPRIELLAWSIIQKSGLLKRLLGSGIQLTCKKL